MYQSHHFELTVAADDAMALERIVGLCRARRCPIVALEFVAAQPHRTGELQLTVEARGDRARLLAHLLSGLVGVRGLRRPA
jgi:acetolactate synthase regulatory subunit